MQYKKKHCRTIRKKDGKNMSTITEKVRDTLVKAGSCFRSDQIEAYQRAIEKEKNPQAKWTMEKILANAKAAKEQSSPLCDDTGIPHLILEVGEHQILTGEMLQEIYQGVQEGLRLLPGRPMAVKGDARARIEQSEGLYGDSAMLEPAPLMLKYTKEDEIRLTVLMQGGGPEIRAKTYRVFHKHSMETVRDEIISWAKAEVGNLGCTPCNLAVGIGRSHYEASSMMLQAMARSRFGQMSELEQQITNAVNETQVGPLGLGGQTTVLSTFVKIGPQRASGVRIVCMRPCCCFEPRKASVILT